MDAAGIVTGSMFLITALAELRFCVSERLTRRPRSDPYYRFRRGVSVALLLAFGGLLLAVGFIGDG